MQSTFLGLAWPQEECDMSGKWLAALSRVESGAVAVGSWQLFLSLFAWACRNYRTVTPYPAHRTGRADCRLNGPSPFLAEKPPVRICEGEAE
jgi:hypothetical protein